MTSGIDVQRWLDRYVEAWRTYDEALIGDLFAVDVEYRYHPWDEPVRGRASVVRSWTEPDGDASDRDEPGTWRAAYEPFAVDGDRAVAVGRSEYLAADGSVDRTYHNVFLLRFDADGRCAAFTEWFMLQPPAGASAGAAGEGSA